MPDPTNPSDPVIKYLVMNTPQNFSNFLGSSYLSSTYKLYHEQYLAE